jgi:hypothetical protein
LRRSVAAALRSSGDQVAAALRSSGDQVAAALQARPATECAWHALRAAFDALITDVEGHDDLARSLHRMLQQEPEVRAASYERSHRWLDRLEPLIAQRLANTQPDPAATTTTDLATTNNLRARALIGSAIACFDAAQLTWAAHPGQSLAPLVDQAMQTLAPIR